VQNDKLMPTATITILMLLLFGCMAAPVINDKGAAVAVWDLKDLSPGGYLGPEIGEIFSSKVIQAAKEAGRYEVVERQRLILALEELRLGVSLADEDTRLTVGKIVGARFMIFGSYQVFQEKMRIDLKFVDVQSGRVLNSVGTILPHGNLEEWLVATKRLADELLRLDRKSLLRPCRTASSMAFVLGSFDAA